MVQQAMIATAKAHPDCGVAVWPPSRMRRIEGFNAATHHVDADVEPLNTASAVALDALASRIALGVAKERDRGIRTLIMSEENFLGGMPQNLGTGGFYANAAQRLECYDTLLPLSPSRVALAVRDYGSVWESAYNFLPPDRFEKLDLETVRSGLLNDKRGWPEVVEDARAVWPDATFVMWQQEKLNKDARAVCAQLMGLHEDQIVLPKGRANAGKKRVGRSVVFTPEERKHLSHRYNRHLRRLEDLPLRWLGREEGA